MKKYTVLLYEYAGELEIEAKNKKEALEKAQEQVKKDGMDWIKKIDIVEERRCK